MKSAIPPKSGAGYEKPQLVTPVINLKEKNFLHPKGGIRNSLNHFGIKVWEVW